MQFILDTIKKLLPKAVLKKIRPIGHGFLAYVAALYYGFPSEQMIVVGVTGTAGKTTTIQMLSCILNSSGRKTGYSTTISHFDGDTEYINEIGLSMPGRFLLQKYLSEMLKKGCKYALIETTSEGLAQNRHLGINFDLALLTNLSEAHLDTHGGFVKYVQAKKKLFIATVKGKKKKIMANKVIGVNLGDGTNAKLAEFLNFPDVKKFVVTDDGLLASNLPEVDKIYFPKNLVHENDLSTFEVQGQHFEISLPGSFNAQNALLAAASANVLGVGLVECAQALKTFTGIRGRMQKIYNHRDIKIFLDYAPEPEEMRQALATIEKMPHKNIIHVFGSTGGHRDVAKRFEFGKISAAVADKIIITNDDVYDSDPEEIAQNIRMAVEQSEEKENKVYTVLDRREAIKKALEMATANDIILITGKGSEQFLVLPGNKRIAWDEAKIIQDML